MVEHTPDGLIDAGARAGFVSDIQIGQVIDANHISQIELGPGQAAVDYSFCEIEPVSISGRVQLATDDLDCFSSDVYHEPVSGVVVQLFDENGMLVDETVTDSNGEYEFLALLPGSYSVREITPEGLLDGGARQGLVDEILVGQVIDPNNVVDILLGSGQISQALLI